MKKLLVLVLTLAVCIPICACSFNQADGITKTAIISVEQIPFEEIVDNCTNIVEATFNGRVLIERRLYNRFTVVGQIKGTTPDKELKVLVWDNDYILVKNGVQYDDNDTKYEKGKNYFVLLTRHKSVYVDFDYYTNYGNCLIPTDNIESGKTYFTKKLSDNALLTSDVLSSRDSFVGFIKNRLEGDTAKHDEYIGNDFIRSDDVNEIISGSDYVAKLRLVKKTVDGTVTLDNDVFECVVLKEYKGTQTAENISVVFKCGTQKVGDEVTVALAGAGVDATYRLSSTNSIINTEIK